MPKFFMGYRGGTPPTLPQEGQAMMARWKKWMVEMGEKLVEPQNPFGPTVAVIAGGSEDGGANPYSGYSVVMADNLDEAKAIAASCPFLDMENSFIDIAEIKQM